MIVFTNPKHKWMINTILEEEDVIGEKLGIGVRPINEIPFTIKLDDSCPLFTDSRTEFVEPIIDRFIEHEDTEWERYFKFVVPKKIPFYYVVEEPSYTVTDGLGNILSGKIR